MQKHVEDKKVMATNGLAHIEAGSGMLAKISSARKEADVQGLKMLSFLLGQAEIELIDQCLYGGASCAVSDQIKPLGE